MLLNMLYAFFAVFVFFNVFRRSDLRQVENITISAYLSALACVLMNIAGHYDNLSVFFRQSSLDVNQAYAPIATFMPAKLEAALLAAFCVLVMKRKWGMLVWTLNMFISMLYLSRTAFVMNTLTFIWYTVYIRKVKFRTLLPVLLVIAVMVYVVLNLSIGRFITARFLNIGHEGASLARESMWSDMLEVIVRHPLGVGPGNIMFAIPKVTGHMHSEADAHNIFMQYISDEGIIVGGLFFAGSILWILKHEAKRKFQEPMGVFMLMYFVQGMFQLKGAEGWVSAVCGIYFVLRERESLRTLI